MTSKSELKKVLNETLMMSQNCAKWCNRRGPIAVALRNYMGLSPKQYRKLIVELSSTVETRMCSRDWDNINFSHVPSLASIRYRKAFNRHTPKYAEYIQSLVNKEEGVKVTAGAVYPHNILGNVITDNGINKLSKVEQDHIIAQWDALENFIGDANILPLVDVSGSMIAPINGKFTVNSITCLQVAVSLGLYCADKNKGKFNGTFLTFTGRPELIHLKGDIIQKCKQMSTSRWEMNTNLHAAMDKILQVAKEGNVPSEEMPKMLLIFSDMQFDTCVKYDDSAMEMIKRKYEESNYPVPLVTFWNLRSTDNVPVRFDERGTALVSGFSPSILKAVLNSDFENFTPWSIMMNAIMNPRYDC